MKVFAIYNIKGGVGKTASSVNLAYLSALEGARTLVWDLDPQGAATFYFRVKPKVKGGGKKLIEGTGNLDPRIRGTDFDNLDLLPADFSYRTRWRSIPWRAATAMRRAGPANSRSGATKDSPQAARD